MKHERLTGVDTKEMEDEIGGHGCLIVVTRKTRRT